MFCAKWKRKFLSSYNTYRWKIYSVFEGLCYDLWNLTHCSAAIKHTLFIKATKQKQFPLNKHFPVVRSVQIWSIIQVIVHTVRLLRSFTNSAIGTYTHCVHLNWLEMCLNNTSTFHRVLCRTMVYLPPRPAGYTKHIKQKQTLPNGRSTPALERCVLALLCDHPVPWWERGRICIMKAYLWYGGPP